MVKISNKSTDANFNGGNRLPPEKKANDDKLGKRIGDAALKGFTQSKKSWRYLSQGISFAKSTLNCAKNIIKPISGHVSPLVSKLGLTAILSAPFSAYSLTGTIPNIAKCAKISDAQGIAVLSLGATLQVGDIVNSTVSFLKAGIQVAQKPSLELLGNIGTGLSFGLITINTISKFVSLRPLCRFRNRVKKIDLKEKTNTVQTAQKVNDLVTSLIGVTEKERDSLGNDEKKIENLRARKVADLKRATSPVYVKKIQAIHKKTVNAGFVTPQDSAKTKEVLSQAKKLSERKITMISVGIVINTIKTVALGFFLVASIPAAIPFAMLASMAAARIGTLVYEDHFMNRSL